MTAQVTDAKIAAAPPPPSFAAGFMASARLAWLRTLRGRKLRLAAAATFLVVLVGVALRWSFDGAEPEQVTETTVRIGFFGLLAFLLPYLFASGAISEEIEARTFTFLATRAAGRAVIVLGKYAVATIASASLLALGVLALHLGAFATDPTALIDGLPGVARSIGALAVLSACYCSIAIAWSALVPEAAGLLVALHFAVIEFLFSFLPGLVRLLSMNFLAREVAELVRGGFMPDTVPVIGVGPALAVIVAFTVLCLAVATLRVATSELGFGRG